jgi:hypothetical protein
MKIAIYQGYLNIHFEMLGYILDYFISSIILFDLYNPTNKISLNWNQFYEQLFNKRIPLLDPFDFNPDMYDLIFLITDDDTSFTQEWLNKYGESKVICIDHSAKIRRLPIEMMRLGTRFFTNRPKCLWALPIYTFVTKIDKQNYLKQSSSINVTCIGIQNRPPSSEFLKELFINFDSITFHIITRKLHSTYSDCTNIKTYENCQTNQMMEILKTTQYVMCFENPNNLEPTINSISAAIPLAFNAGCQLLIPTGWNNYYRFTSIITYEDNLLQKKEITSKIFLPVEIDLDKIYKEAFELISHKNRIFDLIIDKKLNIKINNLNNSSIYSIICSNLYEIKPNILIKLNNNNILEDYQDFREVHMISSNNDELINSRNIFYHNEILDLATKFIFKIYEPIIIHLNNNDESFIKILEVISLRGYKDILIIDNGNIDIINKNFCKLSAFYKFDNLIIIISQK